MPVVADTMQMVIKRPAEGDGDRSYFRCDYRKIQGGALYNEPAIICDGEILNALGYRYF